MDQENIVIQTIDGVPRYCRTVSNESIELVKKIKRGYTCKGHVVHPLIVPSGTTATSVSLNVYAKKFKLANNNTSPNIIYGNELYCDTVRTIKYLNMFEACPMYVIDVNDTDAIMELFVKLKDQDNILMLESCSNPSGFIFDWKIIPKLRKISKKLIVIVDNTWLTHIIFNPFLCHADIVVLSLTKYYGAGNHIGGAIISNSSNIYGSMNHYVKVFGLHVSPFACKIIGDAMTSIENRIIHTSLITKQVVEFMKNNKFEFDHPCEHSRDKVEKYFNKNSNSNIFYPGVIRFSLPLSCENAANLIKSLDIKFETSYGSAHSRISNYLTKITDNVTHLRLSIGSADNYQRLHKNVLIPLAVVYQLDMN